MMNSSTLLSALRDHLDQRGVEVERLTVDPMVELMIDWFHRGPIAGVSPSAGADTLIHRYGGWSEGCVTGFKFSVLRRLTEKAPTGTETEWLAGITLMFEPSKYADLTPFSTQSDDWQSLEAFRNAIGSSPAYAACASTIPLAVVVESGGLR
jgi:hypothetical protein